MKMSPKSLKNKSQKKKSSVKGVSQVKDQGDYIVFSFKDLDETQKSDTGSINHWQKEGLLLKLLNTIKDLSKMRRNEACFGNNSKIKIYGNFPESSNTEYSYPAHVADEAEWARFHLQGKEIIVGHIVNNIFYVVFLDKDHKFYISEKKNT